MPQTSMTSAANLAVNNSLEDSVKAFFAAIPDLGTNSVGVTARSVMVNRTRGATPGRATTPYPFVDGDKFINIFFPNYAPMTYQDNVTPVTAVLDDSFWSSLSVAVLCEAMYNLTSNLRSQILINKVTGDINGDMSKIQNSGKAWYSFLLARVSSDVSTTYQAIPPGQYPQALSIYRNSLTNPAWINAKISQYQSGTWSNPDWELYHHWIKLLLLGDSDASIDSLIQQLVSLSLPIPNSVTQGNWKSYFKWFGEPISWQDISADASNGILEEECYTYPGSMFPSCMKESNSYEFTANSQPGNKYREDPSSCCFKAGTMVIMADHSLKPIEQIQPGEKVMSPTGPNTVALVSTPLRAKRTLYSFSGVDFEFADTHPFITSESLTNEAAPTFACVEPLRLIESVPLLSPSGVVPLSGDQHFQLCQYNIKGEKSISIPSLLTHPSDSETELLYDLILNMEQSGISEYYAGDKNVQLRVSSEIPRYVTSPEVSYALLLMLYGCDEVILDSLQLIPEEKFLDAVTVGLNVISTTLLPSVFRNLPAKSLQSERVEENATDSVQSMITQMFTKFSQPQTNNAVTTAGLNYNPNTRYGNLYNSLASIFGKQFVSALDLGWRNMTYVDPSSATMLAISVYSVELVGTFHLPEKATLQLHIELSNGQAVFSTDLIPVDSDKAVDYFHIFDQCAYFDKWRPGTAGQSTASPLWSVSFQLVDAQRHKQIGGKGTINLPREMKAGLQKEIALIKDESGHLIGHITFDTRQINDSIFHMEQQSRQNWTQEKKQALAKSLGEGAGSFVAQRFPEAIKLFGQIAMSNSQSVFKPVPQPQS